MKKNILFIILTAVILQACGYTTRSVLPSGESSLYVDNFINKIDITQEVTEEKIYYAYLPGMESDITREVIDKFILDGNFELKGVKRSQFLLKGELRDFRREPLRYDANDNVVEYRLSVVVDIELHDLKETKIVWREKSFAGESTYRTTGQFSKSESVAIDEAISDLARRIVERTVENW
jgi:hypothetical protein